MSVYYVDQTGGDDGASGLTELLAWKTLAKVSASSFSGDDQILLKRDGVWRETLTVPSSGTSGHPITFGAYGSGADPLIKGSNSMAGWAAYVGGNTENFTDGSGAKPDGWWMLTEASGSRSDGNPTNNNTLTEEGGTISRSTGPNANVPYAATFTAASSQALSRTGANLSAGFPGKFGVADKSVTVGCWIKPNGLATSGPIGMGFSYEISLYVDGTLGFRVIDDAFGTEDAYAVTHATNAQWIHVVGRWNQGTGAMNIFINGVDDTSGSHTRATMVQWNGDAFKIGWVQQWNYFNGDIAEPFVFPTALTDQQISDIYSGGLAGISLAVWSVALTTEPKIVLFDGVRGTKATSIAGCNAPMKWYWAANVLYTYATADPLATYSLIEAGFRDYSVILSSKSYLTFTGGLCICQSNHSGIWFQNSPHVTLDGITLKDNFYHGNNNFHAGGQNSQYLTVRNCTLTYNGGCGFTINDNGISAAMSHFLIERNIVHHNGWNDDESAFAKWCAGIKIFGGNNTDAIIQDNESYSNYAGSTASGMGIWVDTWGTGAIVRRNKVHDNALRGIMIEITAGAEVYYNLSYNNTDAGIALMSFVASPPVSGNHVYNNVSYGNSIGIQVFSFSAVAGNVINNLVKNNIFFSNTVALSCTNGGENDGTNGSGNIYEYNCLGSEAANFITWGAATPDTYDAWETLYGSGTNSAETDPLFVNAPIDFHLQGTSPCINAGVDVSLTVDYQGTPINGLPDIGIYEYPPITSGGESPVVSHGHGHHGHITRVRL